jgi:hypothetical protein
MNLLSQNVMGRCEVRGSSCFAKCSNFNFHFYIQYSFLLGKEEIEGMFRRTCWMDAHICSGTLFWFIRYPISDIDVHYRFGIFITGAAIKNSQAVIQDTFFSL